MTYLEGDWHRYVIQGIAMAKAGTYIEIGVRGCETISQVMPYCESAHGVDIDFSCARLMPPAARFWHMDSDTFFDKYDGALADIIFIDADHEFGHVLSDFNHSLDLVKPDGVIILHDTWPYLNGDRHPGCGGAHLVAENLATSRYYDALTIPRFPGLTLVTKHG